MYVHACAYTYMHTYLTENVLYQSHKLGTTALGWLVWMHFPCLHVHIHMLPQCPTSGSWFWCAAYENVKFLAANSPFQLTNIIMITIVQSRLCPKSHTCTLYIHVRGVGTGGPRGRGPPLFLLFVRIRTALARTAWAIVAMRGVCACAVGHGALRASANISP